MALPETREATFGSKVLPGQSAGSQTLPPLPVSPPSQSENKNICPVSNPVASFKFKYCQLPESRSMLALFPAVSPAFRTRPDTVIQPLFTRSFTHPTDIYQVLLRAGLWGIGSGACCAQHQV